MSPDDAQEPMDPGDLEPKHRVFLCHSGAQKGFVEQLDKDLRSVDRYSFFDKARECLAIGDNFPSLILEAIERCQVGVVFLSEEFFVRSHWPMFEVVRMVECGRRIMPIFLGISPGDISNEENVAKWKSKWELWAKCNGRIDVARWESTLRSLRPLNGLVCNDAIGEVKFREEIVKELCKIVPPFHVWDDSHVQGRSRICKLIQVKFSQTPMSKKGVQVIGLYGVGGIGKTTACKSLCKDLLLEFDGRVCHIEFGDDTSELDRVREVLKQLTNTDNEFLKDRKLDECWNRLEGLLRLNKVVLAIDNVSSCQRTYDEVEKYLSLEFKQGSIVMVSARALGELRNLSIETSNYLEMPELVEDEARALFLNHAKPKSVVDERIVMECVNRCYFGKGDGNGSKHYHPLALKVLGSQLIGRHPSDWISQLKEEDVFNQLQEQDNPVFSILRRSFDTLKDDYKMLFMDVALFDDGGDLKNWKIVEQSHDDLWCIKDEMRTWYTIFDWLSIVHGLNMGEVKKRLSELKRRSLLEELGDGTSQIGMHDLWREFAVIETKCGEKGSSHWVYEHDAIGNQESAVSCMASGGWKKLRRICITKSRVKHMNFNKCSKVTVLRLNVINVENEALDLSQMKSIKSLEIVKPGNHYKIYDEQNDKEVEEHKVSGIGQLLNLAVLVWWDIDDRSLSAVEEVSCLTNLRILQLRLAYWSDYKSPMSLDLQQLRYLQDVRVELPGMVSISGLSSRMKGLRILNLAGCSQLRSCVGVGNVDGLEVLLLTWCSKLEELPNLQKLIRLRILGIHGCKLLKALPGLGSLVALQVLYGWLGCLAMKELPSMSNLAKLEVLELGSCYELKCIPGLGSLVALRVLGVFCGWLHGLPDLRNFTKLLKLKIYGSNSDDCKAGCVVSGNVLSLAMFESVSTLKISGVDHELSNLSKLTALKSLELRDCHLKRLPHMGSDMILESLTINGCEKLRGWDSVRGLGTSRDTQVDMSSDWTLPYLKEIVVWECESFELPDLCHFPQLRRLSLCGWGSCDSMPKKPVVQCHAIHMHLETLDIYRSEVKELPDLRNFPSLRSVEILECDNLTNLAISEPLSALRHFVLSRCRNLHTVPNTNLFPRLTKFAFQQCGVQLYEHEVQKLIASGFGDEGFGEFWRDPSSDVVVPPAAEPNWHADEQAAVDAPNDLDAGPSRLEPCTSEFIPYNESLSEFGKISVPKRALELVSSSCSDQEQTKKLKNIKSCSG